MYETSYAKNEEESKRRRQWRKRRKKLPGLDLTSLALENREEEGSKWLRGAIACVTTAVELQGGIACCCRKDDLLDFTHRWQIARRISQLLCPL